MVLDAGEDPGRARGVIGPVADLLGVHPKALRNWVRRSGIDGGVGPGTTTDDATRPAGLGREVGEIGGADEISRTSSQASGCAKAPADHDL